MLPTSVGPEKGRLWYACVDGAIGPGQPEPRDTANLVLMSARMRRFVLRVGHAGRGVVVEPLGVVHELDVCSYVLASALDALAGVLPGLGSAGEALADPVLGLRCHHRRQGVHRSRLQGFV